MELNTLDYIVLFVIFLSAILALLRGFVRELVSLIAWISAFLLGTKCYSFAVPFAHRYFKADKVAEWAAMGMVFTASLIVFLTIGYFVCKLVKGQVLTAIDRSMGFLYGLARGFLVVCLVYLGAVLIFWPDIDTTSPEQLKDKDSNHPPEVLMNAKTRPMMKFGANILVDILPKEMIGKDTEDAFAHGKEEIIYSIERGVSDSVEETTEYPAGSNGPINVDSYFNQDKKQ